MKTINIYLASSEELTEDKNALGNMVRRLDEIYSKRGVRVDMVDSDDLIDDSEKSSVMKNSQMFVALFHKNAGNVTIEELKEATIDLKSNNFPKIYTYCRDLTEYDKESQELADFKKMLYEELGHYWCKYGNQDTLQLHFVMQIQHIEIDNLTKLEVKDGKVKIGNEEIINLENVPFVANNIDFQKKKEKLLKLKEKVEKKRLKVEKDPDDEDYKEELIEVLAEYNDLKKEVSEDENNIFKTAMEITKLQQGFITDRMRRAMDAFERGEVREANVILEEARHDADIILDRIKKSKQILEKDKSIGRQSVDELRLNIKTILADTTILTKNRKLQAGELYEKACFLAEESDYEDEKYYQLLNDYYNFLFMFSDFEKARTVIDKKIILINRLGLDFLKAEQYCQYSMLYQSIGDNEKSLEYGEKSLKSITDYPDDDYDYRKVKADALRLLGDVYNNEVNLDKNEARSYYRQALSLYESLGDFCELEYVKTTLTLGLAEYLCEDKEASEKCFDYVIENEDKIFSLIDEMDNGVDMYLKAAFYEFIGLAYDFKDMHQESENYLTLSMEIFSEYIGENNPRLGEVYWLLGDSLVKNGNYEEALCRYNKAMEMFSKIYGNDSIQISSVLDSMSNMYEKSQNYAAAIECCSKSIEIIIKISGESNEYVADEYQILAGIYDNIDDFDNAILFYNKSLDIKEKIFGNNSIEIVNVLNDIARCHKYMENFDKSLELYNKILDIKRAEYVTICDEIITTYFHIALLYDYMGDANSALQQYNEVVYLKIKCNIYDNTLARTYYYVGRLYVENSDNQSALIHYQKSLKVFDDLYADGNYPSPWYMEIIQEMEEYLSNNEQYLN